MEIQYFWPPRHLDDRKEKLQAAGEKARTTYRNSRGIANMKYINKQFYKG